MRAAAIFALLSLTAACTDGGGSDDTGATGDTDPSVGPPSDAAFFVSGTYIGAPYEVACNFDESDDDWQADLQCQDGIQYFAYCRPSPDEPVAGVEFQVWFNLPWETAPGSYEYSGLQGALGIGNRMSDNLAGFDTNNTTNEVVIDAVDPGVSVSGTVNAAWTDEGGDYGDASGSFQFQCQ